MANVSVRELQYRDNIQGEVEPKLRRGIEEVLVTSGFTMRDCQSRIEVPAFFREQAEILAARDLGVLKALLVQASPDAELHYKRIGGVLDAELLQLRREASAPTEAEIKMAGILSEASILQARLDAMEKLLAAILSGRSAPSD